MEDLGCCEQFRRVRQRFKYSPLCPECNTRINFISDYVTHRVGYHNINHNRVYDDLVYELRNQNLWDDCRQCYDPCGGRYYTPSNSWYGWNDICSNYPPYPCCGTNPHKCGCEEPLKLWRYEEQMRAGQDIEKGDRVKIYGGKVYKDNSVIICHSFYCEYCKRHSSRFKNIKLSWPNGTNGFDCYYCGRWNYLSDYERDQIANSMRVSK